MEADYLESIKTPVMNFLGLTNLERGEITAHGKSVTFKGPKTEFTLKNVTSASLYMTPFPWLRNIIVYGVISVLTVCALAASSVFYTASNDIPIDQIILAILVVAGLFLGGLIIGLPLSYASYTILQTGPRYVRVDYQNEQGAADTKWFVGARKFTLGFYRYQWAQATLALLRYLQENLTLS